MTTDPLRLAVIVGSVRDGRLGPTVATWFAGQATARPDLDVDMIDLVDVPIGGAAPSMSAPTPVLQALSELTPRLASADAFVVVTPSTTTATRPA